VINFIVNYLKKTIGTGPNYFYENNFIIE